MASGANRHTVLRVIVRSGNTFELDGRVKEVERYLYGRSFYLGRVAKPGHAPMHALFFIVEEHYRQSIIDRLASGLFWAGVATPEERALWLVEGEEN